MCCSHVSPAPSVEPTSLVLSGTGRVACFTDDGWPTRLQPKQTFSFRVQHFFALFLQILFLPKLSARASVWTLFILLPFCFLSPFLGVGREAIKAQRVRRVRPQRRCVVWHFSVRVVLFCVSFQDGWWSGVPGSIC